MPKAQLLGMGSMGDYPIGKYWNLEAREMPLRAFSVKY